MSDNVLILGAGFSWDAGIPLLGGFVEKMLDYAIRKTCDGKPLDSTDIEIFERLSTSATGLTPIMAALSLMIVI
jgi:hypothetical protein